MYKAAIVAGIVTAGLLAAGCGGGSGGGSSAVSGEQATAITHSSASTGDVSLVAHLIADATTGTTITPSCPVTTHNGSVTEFNFGMGCSSPVTGGSVVAGQIFINTDARYVVFSGFSVNGRAITGEIDFETQNGGATVILTFKQFAIAGVGAFSGTVKDTFVHVNVPGHDVTTADVLDSPAVAGGQPMVVTPASGSIAPCPPATSESYVISLDQVKVDAELNGNLVPMAGTVGIAFDSEIAGACRATSIALAFNASSPSSKSAQATIDGAKTVTVSFTGK